MKKNNLEAQECIKFHTTLQTLLAYNQLNNNFFYFHIPQERIQPKTPGEKAKFFGHLNHLKQMGAIPGVPDYIFILKNNCETFFLEFKALKKTTSTKTGKILTTKGYKSESQHNFQAACLDKNIPYHIIYSAKEGLEYVVNKLMNNNLLSAVKGHEILKNL